jgi:hypothetical protein
MSIYEYNALAVTVLLCGKEVWTLRRKDRKKKIDINRDETLEQLKVEPGDQKLRRRKSNWLRHVTGINSNGMPKIMPNCRPKGTRQLGRPLKRLLDLAETGLFFLTPDL